MPSSFVHPLSIFMPTIWSNKYPTLYVKQKYRPILFANYDYPE